MNSEHTEQRVGSVFTLSAVCDETDKTREREGGITAETSPAVAPLINLRYPNTEAARYTSARVKGNTLSVQHGGTSSIMLSYTLLCNRVSAEGKQQVLKS